MPLPAMHRVIRDKNTAAANAAAAAAARCGPPQLQLQHETCIILVIGNGNGANQTQGGGEFSGGKPAAPQSRQPWNLGPSSTNGSSCWPWPIVVREVTCSSRIPNGVHRGRYNFSWLYGYNGAKLSGIRHVLQALGPRFLSGRKEQRAAAAQRAYIGGAPWRLCSAASSSICKSGQSGVVWIGTERVSSPKGRAAGLEPGGKVRMAERHTDPSTSPPPGPLPPSAGRP
jgi:hypothetical protein